MFEVLLTNVTSSADVRAQLKEKFFKHRDLSYKDARVKMYNEIDCEMDRLYLLYAGSSIKWKCHSTRIPMATVVNAEHVVPQSFFASKHPMVSDLHHLISSSAKLNGRRSNYRFDEFSYDDCEYWCHDNDCSTTRPKNPDEYSCLSYNNRWMPRKGDRGQVARAVLYWFTMYDDQKVPLSKLGDVQVFINWANTYPPSQREIRRNKFVEQIQGNLNPYIVDPSLIDKAWP